MPPRETDSRMTIPQWVTPDKQSAPEGALCLLLTSPCPRQTRADPPAQSTFVSNGQPLFHHEPLLTSRHCSTDPAKVTRSRDSQYQKAEDPMLVTPSGMVTEVREVQSQKA